MYNPTRVYIGIQARSTSTRLPSKVFEKIGDKTMLNHVVDSCLDAARYLNRNTSSNDIRASVALLVPKGDPIVTTFKSTRSFDAVSIIEGDEHDVLSRYMELVKAQSPDYIVRITADCPLIPHFVISKHISNAVVNESDYESNVDERVRTAPDGWDCEVLSKRILEYANENAKSPSDREHVSTFIRSNPPEWIRHGTTISFLPMFGMLPKLSVDTQEDLERVRDVYAQTNGYYQKALELFGKWNVHRF